MASVVYDKFLKHLVQGDVNFSTGTFKVMLVSSSDAANKAVNEFRSSVTGIESSGTGYTASGVSSAVTMNNDTTNHKETATFASVSWSSATVSAVGCIIYLAVGSSATDILIAYVDFGSTVSSTAATFAVTFSSPLTFQN